MIAQNTPAELQALVHWLVWREEERNGKKTKVPYDAKNGEYAKVNDSSTWSSLACATKAADVLSGKNFDGIGFVFSETNLVGIDLDGLVRDGKIAAYALSIIRLANTYCEYSPSGTGVHVIFQTSLPLPNGNKFGNKELGGEIYDKTSPRYFTFTSNKIADSADTIAQIDDPDQIALLHFLVSKVPDSRFTLLWTGDTSSQKDDNSKADYALLCELAKFTQCDPVKMEKFFNVSARGQREKWLERKDYRDMTIAKAIKATSGTQKEYSESGNSPPKESAASGIVFHLPAATGGTHKDWAFAPSPEMYEGWCPRGSISVIAGTSGVGKTRLIIPGLLAQRLHAPFLGHASAGYSFAIIGADRGEHDFYRTMESMRFPLDAFPFQRVPLTAFDLKAVQAICNSIEALNPMPEFIFVEGLDMMLSNVNDAHTVAMFVSGLQTIATHYHLSILGSVGSPKAKAGQDYNLTRDNIIGTGTWGRGVCTVFLMQYADSKDSKGKRIVTVAARGAREEKFTLEFQDGMLVVVPNDPEPNEAEAKGRKLAKHVAEEIEWYQKMAREGKTDPAKEWWTVQDMARELGRSPATAAQHIGDAITKHFIIMKSGPKPRGGKNSYKWNEVAANPEWVEHPVDDLDL